VRIALVINQKLHYIEEKEDKEINKRMNLKIYFYICQIFSFLPIFLCQCTRFEVNVDYIGDDLKSYLTDSIENCCQSCILDTRCLIWTYVYSSKICYLKNGNNAIRVLSQDRNYKFYYLLLFWRFLPFLNRFKFM